MKTTLWIAGAVIVLVGGFFALNHFIYTQKQAGTLMYQNAQYGYALSYPDTLQVKEYTPEDTVFGIITGDMVEGVAEARVMTIAGSPGESFDQALARELENLCAADGPRSSFSCTGVETTAPFTNDAGLAGTKLYLHGEKKDLGSGAVTGVSKGPYYAFVLGTGATASQVLVIHAPLNKSAAEADAATIEAIARSAVLPAQTSGPSGDGQQRYMDIESYVKNSINELAPVKATLGGTFQVTTIETHGGAGTVAYEDGHSTYLADFTYAVSQDGKPTITSFTIRER
ncbi:MAG TPA: hypothetical protein VHD37_02390 [Candidatus Paceibacterota bacterium]|nr:hypothetical protein [Candidatus Paceibacterota bacterium]